MILKTKARILFVFSLTLLTTFVFESSSKAQQSGNRSRNSRADHLVLMVFDQMRPDYIDRYNLPNFRRLRSSGTHYPNAYVGHMGAETVVSHFVISSGLLPREMPWQDEVYQDTRNLLGGGPGLFYSTGGLNQDQLTSLMNHVPRTGLLPYKIKQKFHDGKVFAIGEKAYAAVTFGTPQADSVITFRKADGICTPSGVHVPNYISGNDRYTVGCRDTYGTTGSLYPLDGARSVPGTDPDHQGGDVWVADVAREVMDREGEWRALFLTFAGIDKVGHMLGDIDVNMPNAFDSRYSVEDALRIADTQLGRILDKLQEQGLLNRTLIVVTADHGGQSNVAYLGNGQKSHGGEDLVDDRSSPQSYFVDRMLRTNRVRVTYQDTAMRFWLRREPATPAAETTSTTTAAVTTSDDQLIRILSETSGLVEAYRLTQIGSGFTYSRVFQNLSGQSVAFRRWARAHNQELVNSMATAGAPDIIGLLADGFGFDLPGDHGGAQERVQRIPIIVKGPGVRPTVSQRALRLVDLNQRVSELMDLH